VGVPSHVKAIENGCTYPQLSDLAVEVTRNYPFTEQHEAAQRLMSCVDELVTSFHIVLPSRRVATRRVASRPGWCFGQRLRDVASSTVAHFAQRDDRLCSCCVVTDLMIALRVVGAVITNAGAGFVIGGLVEQTRQHRRAAGSVVRSFNRSFGTSVLEKRLYPQFTDTPSGSLYGLCKKAGQ